MRTDNPTQSNLKRLQLERAERIRLDREAGMEEAEAEAAEVKRQELEAQFVEGKPLPDWFENPGGGNPNHRCVRRLVEGRGKGAKVRSVYMPKWHQVFLTKRDSTMPNRQFVNTDEVGPIKIPTNVWVDVPEGAIMVLRGCIEEVVSHDFDKSIRDVSLQEVPVVVEERPRFSLQSIKGA